MRKIMTLDQRVISIYVSLDIIRINQPGLSDVNSVSSAETPKHGSEAVVSSLAAGLNADHQDPRDQKQAEGCPHGEYHLRHLPTWTG